MAIIQSYLYSAKSFLYGSLAWLPLLQKLRTVFPFNVSNKP